MPQETEDEARREFGSEPCGGGNSLRQTWSLNHTFGNQPGDRPSCVGPSDHGERIECGSLFWYDPIKTKTGEAPTQGLKSGHRCRQAAPSRFGSQLETIMHACTVEGGDQPVVVEHIPRDDGPPVDVARSPFHRACTSVAELTKDSQGGNVMR